MVLAWLKLRQRNLGPLLDASGWAINGCARINVPFGAARSLHDPYAEKRPPWVFYAIFAFIVSFSGFWCFVNSIATFR